MNEWMNESGWGGKAAADRSRQRQKQTVYNKLESHRINFWKKCLTCEIIINFTGCHGSIDRRVDELIILPDD